MDEKHFRKVYIGILEQVSAKGHAKISQDEDEFGFKACSELIDANYVVGTALNEFVPDPEGYLEKRQINVYNVGQISAKGRLFLLQLKEDARADSLAGHLWSKGNLILGFVLGASADVLKDIWLYLANHFFPGVIPHP